MSDLRPILVGLLRDAAVQGVRAYLDHRAQTEAPPRVQVLNVPPRVYDGAYREVALFLASAHRYLHRVAVRPESPARALAVKRIGEAIAAAGTIPESPDQLALIYQCRQAERQLASGATKAAAETVDALIERCLDLDDLAGRT